VTHRSIRSATSDNTLVLCDLDGTLYERGELIRGADRAVASLRSVAAELGTVVRAVSARGEPAHAAVVGDVTGLLDYELLDRAFDAVRRGAHLLALQRGRYFRAEDGDHIDTGAVVAALEFATGATAQVLGKPSVDFAELATADARPVRRTYVRLTCRVGLGGFKGSNVLRPDHI